MKKIQVSTVRQTADVEVIFINANLISKVIKADIAIDSIVDCALNRHAIIPQTVAKRDENGEFVLDDTEHPIEEPVLDEDGKQVVTYDSLYVDADQLRNITENVAPLLRELVEAFNA